MKAPYPREDETRRAIQYVFDLEGFVCDLRLPIDLCEAEAKRLCAMINALVMSKNDSSPSQRLL